MPPRSALVPALLLLASLPVAAQETRRPGVGAGTDGFPLRSGDGARASADARAVGVAVNGYLNRAVRMLLAYERTRFDAAPDGAARPPERLPVSRLQPAF